MKRWIYNQDDDAERLAAIRYLDELAHGGLNDDRYKKMPRRIGEPKIVYGNTYVYQKGDRVTVKVADGPARQATVMAASLQLKLKKSKYKIKDPENTTFQAFLVVYDDHRPEDGDGDNCWVAGQWLSDSAEDEADRLKALRILEKMTGGISALRSK